MRNPKDFFRPLAVGAPEPLREIPVRPSRVIHFFPPANEKMVAKLPSIIPTVDIILGNLEDAVPAADKEAARAGLVKVGKETDFGSTQFWTRVNSLDSPWCLDDLTTLVTEIGDALDVIMIPKVEGPEDIHYVDRLLAQLEAKARLTRPLMVHAILETARGVANVEEICAASPRMQGLSLGPADLAANRRMKTTRVGGGHPGYLVRTDPVLLGCVGAWSLHPVQIDIAKRVFSPDPADVAHARRVIEAMGDGTGAIMLDGKMEDDASVKQCRVMVELAEQLAASDPELAERYAAGGR